MPTDHFSELAHMYARHRPLYPSALFEYILSQTKGRERAWDCATGNGQAAVSLAPHFREVEATDLSAKQLEVATPVPNIRYTVATAEATAFPGDHFDLVTVAQAYHWFDVEAFSKEAQRVGRPGATIAVWMYNLLQCPTPGLQEIFDYFYFDITGPYWHPERKHVDAEYATLPFPFREKTTKKFYTEVMWEREALEGYLSTWSAVKTFRDREGYSPLSLVAGDLDKAWPGGSRLLFRFPVHLQLGKL